MTTSRKNVTTAFTITRHVDIQRQSMLINNVRLVFKNYVILAKRHNRRQHAKLFRSFDVLWGGRTATGGVECFLWPFSELLLVHLNGVKIIANHQPIGNGLFKACHPCKGDILEDVDVGPIPSSLKAF